MLTIKTILALSVLFIDAACYSQSTDTLTCDNSKAPSSINNYFRSFSGGINAVYEKQGKAGVDLAVETFHYYMITSKRAKNDSIHFSQVNQKKSISELYRGFHFFIMNRAVIDFDSIQSMAVNYFTSLKPSPLTLRLKKELFLTRQQELSTLNFVPVISIILTGDGRTVPFVNQSSTVKAGVSGHLYLTFSAIFKRLEYNIMGSQIDEGIVYLKPSIGMAYGTSGLMKSLQPRQKKTPIISTEFQLGFRSEKKRTKDFRFLLGYTLTEIAGPRIRAGLILASIN